MEKFALKRWFVIFITVLLLSSQMVVFAQESTGDGSIDSTVQYLKSIIDMIEERYNGNISEAELIQGALRGIFGSMDDYTTFYTPEEADSFLSNIQGNYEGIGIMMSIRDGYITVVKVFADSPAQKSGLGIGDRIVSADDVNIVGVSLDEAASLIKGESGTKVKLGIIKNGETNVTVVDVERASVKYNPVNYEIRGDIGYIQIDLFNSNTYEYVDEALMIMDQNNITKIILDLRDNPGGTVDQAVAVAERFVPEGLITRLAFKSENMPDIDYRSELKEVKYKLVVLVNGMSASASEILAGAVQDTGAGTIIGTKTYGKSKVQNIFPIISPAAYRKYEEQLSTKIIDAHDLIRNHGILPRDEEIIGWTKITTGEYLTTNGRVIDGIGIVPDIIVEDPIAIQGINIQTIQKLQKSVKPTLGSEGIDVLNAEKILKLKGYDVDTPDIRLDEKTFNAIYKYQQVRGLYPYGVLDFTTQQYLNEDLEVLMRIIDKQYGKAIEVLSK